MAIVNNELRELTAALDEEEENFFYVTDHRYLV